MIFKFVFKQAHGKTYVRFFFKSEMFPVEMYAGTAQFTNEAWEIFRQVLENGAVSTRLVFEEQVTSGPATRGNNDYRPA